MREVFSPRVRVLLVLIVVLAAARIGLWAGARPTDPDAGQLLLSFDPASVHSVELVRGEGRITLGRTPGGWVVTSHGGLPAREGGVEHLLERLAGWRIERLAGQDPSRFEEWKVSQTEARRIRLLGSAGDVLSEVWVGRVTGVATDRATERDYTLDVADMGLFVRRRVGADKAPHAWVVNDFVTRHLEPSLSVWLLRPLLSGQREEVTRVVAESTAGKVALRLRPAPALEGDRRPVDAARAFGALSALFLLEATARASVDPPADAPRFTLEAQGRAPQSFRLWSADSRWFLATERFTVEVRARDAVRAASLASAESVLRRELIRLVGVNVRRVHWTSGSVERSFLGRRGVGWEAVVTGSERPLQARAWSLKVGMDYTKALTEFELEGWILDTQVLERELSGANERLVVVASAGREELTIGPARSGRHAVKSSRLPGLGAWVSAEGLAALRTRLAQLCGE